MIDRATPQATTVYFNEHNLIQKNELSNTGLWISQVGFGTYRVDNDSQEYKTALKTALENGVNLIDTSTNYSNGDSERCIAKVLDDCFERNTLSREQVVIVSKAGYIQGDLYHESQSRKKNNTAFLDLVEYEDELEHCIHPEFLAEQITNSLDRLNLECIDVFLLHNPEYFKFAAQKNGDDIGAINDEYYQRIHKAFDYLEEEVKGGRIQCYGISSNTFPYDAEHPDSTDLKRVMSLSEQHTNFKVIQCPLNVFEKSALYPHENACISIAKEHNIAVLTNRPFNAIYNHQLLRLSEVDDQEETAMIEIDDALYEGVILESELKEKLEELDFSKQLLEYFQLFALLKNSFVNELNLFDFKQMVASTFYPLISQLVHLMAEKDLELDTHDLFEQYIRSVNLSIRMIINYLSNKQNSIMDDVKTSIYDICPDLSHAYRLTNLLLRLYRSSEGVTSVLVGMRHPDYVESVLDELSQSPYDKSSEFWKNTDKVKGVIY